MLLLPMVVIKLIRPLLTMDAAQTHALAATNKYRSTNKMTCQYQPHPGSSRSRRPLGQTISSVVSVSKSTDPTDRIGAAHIKRPAAAALYKKHFERLPTSCKMRLTPEVSIFALFLSVTSGVSDPLLANTDQLNDESLLPLCICSLGDGQEPNG